MHPIQPALQVADVFQVLLADLMSQVVQSRTQMRVHLAGLNIQGFAHCRQGNLQGQEFIRQISGSAN